MIQDEILLFLPHTVISLAIKLNLVILLSRSTRLAQALGYRIDFQLEPFAPRHSISYFNNNKEDSTRSAYERLHSTVFDPSKARCDRTKPSLFWLEISKENKGHKVPMTTNLWYGRPNRVQVDIPEKKFNRSNKMREFYSRFLLIDEDERKVVVC